MDMGMGMGMGMGMEKSMETEGNMPMNASIGNARAREARRLHADAVGAVAGESAGDLPLLEVPQLEGPA